MKKLLLSLFACASLFMVACGPEPEPDPEPIVPGVKVDVLSATPTTVTARFQKNAECTNYTIMISEEGTMGQWMQMFNATLEECVAQWGLTFSKDSTYTWKDMTPATNYQIYYIVRGKDYTKLDSVAVRTSSNGGSGESVISIAISEITDTSAKVTCTPNDQTAMFKDMLIVKDSFDAFGQTTVLDMLKNDPYEYYEQDVWVWTLDPATEYYALAVGKNADNVWGQMTAELFSTTGGSKGGFRIAKGIITRKK